MSCLQMKWNVNYVHNMSHAHVCNLGDNLWLNGLNFRFSLTLRKSDYHLFSLFTYKMLISTQMNFLEYHCKKYFYITSYVTRNRYLKDSMIQAIFEFVQVFYILLRNPKYCKLALIRIWWRLKNMRTCNILFSRRFIFLGWKCTHVHWVFNDSLCYQCQNKQDDITIIRTHFCVFSWPHKINNIQPFVMDSVF